MKIYSALMPAFLGLTALTVPVWLLGAPAIATPTGEQQAIADLLKNSKRFNLCTDNLQRDTAQRFSKAYKVDNQTYFVVVQCFLAAYQGNYEFVLYSPNASRNPVKALTLTEFTQSDNGKIQRVESSSVGALPSFDPKQRILTVLTKYRGVGDCGTQARYRLDGNALKLVNFKAKFDCDGKTEPYQQIYPAR